MSAPTIVLIARGGDGPAVRTSLDVVIDHLHRLRPDFRVGPGLLNNITLMAREAVKALTDTGIGEIAMIPVDLVSATDHSPVLTHARGEVGVANPGLSTVIARPTGPDIDLLSVLGIKLREALHRASAVEMDALILACPDGGDLRESSLLTRGAWQWSAHHRLPVQLAQNDITDHATAPAVNTLRGQGRRHITVGSLFLTPGLVLRAHQQAVIRVGALAVAPPITENPRITELILTRYVFAAIRLLDIDPYENGA